MHRNITPNFTWEEMLYSATARANGIDNRPGTSEMVAIERLVKELLQPLRELYGRPIRITSGYRCAALNRLVGGVPASQHLKGEAADCVASNATRLVDILMQSGLVFDQAIWYKKRNFIHLSLRSQNNRRKLIIQDK